MPHSCLLTENFLLKHCWTRRGRFFTEKQNVARAAKHVLIHPAHHSDVCSPTDPGAATAAKDYLAALNSAEAINERILLFAVGAVTGIVVKIGILI